MPTRFDKSSLLVTVGGADVTGKVLSVKCSYGFDQRISEAEVTFSEAISQVSAWAAISIEAGVASGGDTWGRLPRFTGFLGDPRYTLWPYSLTVKAYGPLLWAQRAVVPSNPEYETKYDEPGDDLTLSPSVLDGRDPDVPGRTDREMILYILSKSGCGGFYTTDSIGGLPHMLGTIAFDQFFWKRGQSGLDFIEALDKAALGFRTFEGLNGQIFRRQIGVTAPFEDTAVTLWEGRDCFEGSVADRRIEAGKNRVIVRGFDDGTGEVFYVAQGAHPAPRPSGGDDTEDFPAPLVEAVERGDPADGLSCQEVAEWKFRELAKVYWEVAVPTWVDYPFAPGQVVYLNSPRLGAINQAFWLRSLDLTVDEQGFTQTLTMRAPDYRAPAPALGSVSLPLSLEVNP